MQLRRDREALIHRRGLTLGRRHGHRIDAAVTAALGGRLGEFAADPARRWIDAEAVGQAGRAERERVIARVQIRGTRVDQHTRAILEELAACRRAEHGRRGQHAHGEALLGRVARAIIGQNADRVGAFVAAL